MSGNAQDRFSHSMTDLMASVAVMFLLLSAIFMVRSIQQSKRERDSQKQALATLSRVKKEQKNNLEELDKLRQTLETDTAVGQVADVIYDTRDPFLLTISVNDSDLSFPAGRCDLSPAGRTLVHDRFPAIFRPVCDMQARGTVESITLEGHTDGQPYFPKEARCGIDDVSRSKDCFDRKVDQGECKSLGFENNVRLSGSRAQAVYFALREMFSSDPALMGCLESQVVVSGRGPVEPSDGRNWREERSPDENRRNRRVVIKLRLRPNSSIVAPAAAGAQP